MNTKQMRLLAVIFVMVPATFFAESPLRGGLESSLDLNIAGGDYESLLNQGNGFGLSDIGLKNQANLRFEMSGDTSSLELRLDFKQYPIADVLLNSFGLLARTDAYSANPSDLLAALPGIADLVYMSGDTIWTADLTRASVSWYPVGWLNITVGRQSFLTGYGYGWNPLDLANPLKDPADPKAVLKGVDGLSVELIPSSWLSLLSYTILPGGQENYSNLAAGAILTMSLTGVEIKAAGLWGGGEEENTDFYPHAGAMAFYADIAGVGLYAEGVVRSKSRRAEITDGIGTIAAVDGPVISVLGGMEYVFPSGLSMVLEYFYNGEGWDSNVMSNYKSTLENPLNLTGDLYSLYTPLYYARHYVMLNMLVSLYDIQSELNASLMFSPDSGILYFIPSFHVELDSTGNLAADISYAGSFDLYGNAGNEVELSPVKHTVEVSMSYVF